MSFSKLRVAKLLAATQLKANAVEKQTCESIANLQHKKKTLIVSLLLKKMYSEPLTKL